MPSTYRAIAGNRPRTVPRAHRDTGRRPAALRRGAAVAGPWNPRIMLRILGVVLVVYGAVVVFRPEIGWQVSMLGRRWQFRDSENLEPSRAGLIVQRVLAVVWMAAGIFFVVLAYIYQV